MKKMSKGLIALIAILVVAILLAILAFGNYNSLHPSKRYIVHPI